jgi:hypothetical protein
MKKSTKLLLGAIVLAFGLVMWAHATLFGNYKNNIFKLEAEIEDENTDITQTQLPGTITKLQLNGVGMVQVVIDDSSFIVFRTETGTPKHNVRVAGTEVTLLPANKHLGGFEKIDIHIASTACLIEANESNVYLIQKRDSKAGDSLRLVQTDGTCTLITNSFIGKNFAGKTFGAFYFSGGRLEVQESVGIKKLSAYLTANGYADLRSSSIESISLMGDSTARVKMGIKSASNLNQ